MQPGEPVPENPDRPQPPIVPELPRPLAPPQLIDPDLSALLGAVSRPDTMGATPEVTRRRLFERIAHSAAAARTFVTVRQKDAPRSCPAPGICVNLLYQAGASQLRRGEPSRVRWIELSPGARWRGDWPASQLQRDWLVVQGQVRVGGFTLDALDYHVVPAGHGVDEIESESGATLYLREAPQVGSSSEVRTTLYAGGDWAEFAPGIRRRVLWAQGAEAAMLYHALPGAAVPRHGHGHDEECLMLEGELFLDELLLRTGEYQLAPAGTHHQGLSTDTGVVIYAHGDIDLAVF